MPNAPTVPASKAEEYYGVRFARQALDIDPAYRPAQIVLTSLLLEKAADRIKPELVLISAGFDAHKDDPIGSLGLETEDFTALTEQVLEVAKAHCKGRSSDGSRWGGGADSGRSSRSRWCCSIQRSYVKSFMSFSAVVARPFVGMTGT